MSDNRIVHDLRTGVKTTYGVEDGKVYTQTEQQIDPFLRNADKSRHAHGKNFSDVKNGMYKRATIPAEALSEWRIKYNFDWFHCDESERRKWMKTEHFKKYELRRG